MCVPSSFTYKLQAEGNVNNSVLFVKRINMGATQGKLLRGTTQAQYEFFRELVRRPVNDSDAASSSWIVTGLVAHSDFILNDMEDATFAQERATMLQEMADLNVETQRIPLLMRLCAAELSQCLCRVQASSPSNASSSSGVKGSTSSSSISATSAAAFVSDVLCPLLRVTGCALRHCIASSCGDALLLSKLLDGTSTGQHSTSRTASSTTAAAAPTAVGPSLRLCESLMEFTASVPLDRPTCAAHHECMRLLVSLCTTQVYHSASTYDEKTADVYVEYMLCSDILKPFMASLLQRLVCWGCGLLPETSYVYRSGYRPALHNLFNMFGTWRSGQCSSLTDVVGRLTADIVAILVTHRRGCTASTSNAALETFRQCVHGDVIDFEMTLEALHRRMVEVPSLLAVFYILLVDHPTFFHSALSKWPTKLADCVASMLELAVVTSPLDYHAAMSGSSNSNTSNPQAGLGEGSNPPPPPASLLHVQPQPTRSTFQNVYCQVMIATILVVLSRDRSYHELAFRHVVSYPKQLAPDRFLTTITVGCLTLAIASKAVTRALADGSEGLAKMFLAAIENASPFANHMDAYTSQRILSLLNTLLRRIAKLEMAMAKQQQINADLDSDAPCYRLLAEREVTVAPIPFIVESIVAMLDGRDRVNHTLTYELLYHRDAILGLSGTNGDGTTVPTNIARGDAYDAQLRRQQLRRMLSPLEAVIANYESEIASVAVNHSPDDILRIIERVAGSSASGNLLLSLSTPVANEEGDSRSSNGGSVSQPSATELLYLYRESKQSCAFFTPFVWATIIAACGSYPGSIPWTAEESKGIGYFPLFYPQMTADN